MKKILIILIACSFLFAARPKNNLPAGSVNGGELVWVNGYTITMGVTNKTSNIKDSTDNFDITWDDAITIVLTNSNASGQYNGLARGITLTSNTLYYVYAIIKGTRPYSNVVYGMVTTNATAPEWILNNVQTNIDRFDGTTNFYTNDIPFAYRKVGSFLTWGTNGTIQACPFIQKGSGRSRVFTTASSESTYQSALPNTGTNATFTTVNFKVPGNATEVSGVLACTNEFSFYAGYTADATAPISLDRTLDDTEDQVTLPVSSSVGMYKVASTAATLYIFGWKEEL